MLGNGDIAVRTAIPRSTVSRLTRTLAVPGYLRYLPRLEKYELGPGILALGYHRLAASGLREVARPHMQAIADTADCAIARSEEHTSELQSPLRTSYAAF